jgi:hypothetical protein
MAKLIRKISIGKDYKNEAMHYAVGQEVYGGHTICDIIEEKEKYSVYIKKIKMCCLGRTLIKTWLFQSNTT